MLLLHVEVGVYHTYRTSSYVLDQVRTTHSIMEGIIHSFPRCCPPPLFAVSVTGAPGEGVCVGMCVGVCVRVCVGVGVGVAAEGERFIPASAAPRVYKQCVYLNKSMSLCLCVDTI